MRTKFVSSAPTIPALRELLKALDMHARGWCRLQLDLEAPWGEFILRIGLTETDPLRIRFQVMSPEMIAPAAWAKVYEFVDAFNARSLIKLLVDHDNQRIKAAVVLDFDPFLNSEDSSLEVFVFRALPDTAFLGMSLLKMVAEGKTVAEAILAYDEMSRSADRRLPDDVIESVRRSDQNGPHEGGDPTLN